MEPVNIIQFPAGPVKPASPAPPVSRAGAPGGEDHGKEAPPLAELVRDLNQAMQAISTSITFSIDGATGKTVIRVSDAGTGELIRQIPAEETLRIAAHLNELMGILYDRTR